MPKSSPIQADFSGGEFGPHVEGRVDVEKAKTGMEEILNYIPTLEGPLVRRPGTKFVAEAKDPSKPPVFIPFKVSNTEQYIIEAGENYFRFFTDQGPVVTSGTSYSIHHSEMYLANNYMYRAVAIDTLRSKAKGPFFASRSNNRYKSGESAIEYVANYAFSSVVSGSILEIRTLYDYNLIQNVSWAQKGDTLWIFHSSVPTFTLQRFGRQDWDLKMFQPKDGPYYPLNSHRNFGDSIGVSLRPVIIGSSVTGKGEAFSNDPKADEFEGLGFLTHSTSVIANIQNISSQTGEAQVFVNNRHGFKDGQDVYIWGVVAGSSHVINNSGQGNLTPELTVHTESSRWKVQVINESSFVLMGSVFSGSGAVYIGSGMVAPALFYPHDAGRNIGVYSGGHRIHGIIKNGSSVLELSDNTTEAAYSFPSPIFARVSLNIENEKTFGSLIQTTTVLNVWQLGVFGKRDGHPSSGTFHQDRLVLNGAPRRPTEFVASETGEYQNFAISDASALIVTAKNAIQFNLNSESNDQLKWVESGQQGLYFASNSTEFLVSPSRDGEAISPTNISNDIVGQYGSDAVRPARIGDAIIYVQNSARKIRELRFFANYQTHKTSLINELSDHITFPSMSRLAVQKEFYPLVWGQRSDGKLISMSYSREEESVRAGWATHELGGQSDSAESFPKVKSMEVIKDAAGKYDQLWMAVQRYINGTSVVTIEYMVEPYQHKNPTQKQRDAFYLDCGATYDSSLVIASITQGSALVTIANHGLQRNDIVLIDEVVGLNSSLLNVNQILVNSNLVNGKMFVVGSTTANNFFLQDFNSSIVLTHTYSPYFSGGKVRKLVSTIGGLTWLKNEEVDVLADGGIHGKATVNSGGFLALNYPAAVVQIGYSYKSRGKTLVKDSGSATGSAIGMQRKTYQVAFRLRDVGDFKYGGIDYLNMHQANLYNADEYQAHQAVPLYTGIYRDGIEQDVSFYGQVVFEQSSPLPGMVQSITYLMDEQDL